MNLMSKTFVVSILFLTAGTVAVAQQGNLVVSHWSDGSSMDCTYVFERSSIVHWNYQMGPPPMVVADVSSLVSDWAERLNLSSPNFISYDLAVARDFTQQDGSIQAWFVEFFSFPSGVRGPFYSSEAIRKLAITLDGTVVEPDCT